jgi:hypothetical protein
MPVGLSLLLRKRSTLARVFRYLAPHTDHSLAIAALAIRGNRQGLVGVAPLSELSHQSQRHISLVLTNGSTDPQTRVYVYRGTSPERTAFSFFGTPPFSPLCPT